MTAVSELLFQADERPEAALESSLARAGEPLGDTGPGSVTVTDSALSTAIAGLLEEPVGNLAVRGWQSHRLVVEACERTRANPGSIEVVELLEHEIASRQHPRLELFVNDVRVRVIQLDLDVALRVDGVGLTIADGRISGWSTGTVVGRAELTASGVSLARREHTLVDLGPARDRRQSP